MAKKEMVKQDLINKVAEETGFTKKQVEEMYDALGYVVRDAVEEGKSFRLFNFLTFSSRVRKGRAGTLINKNQEKIDWVTEDKTVPTVKISKTVEVK